MISWSLDAHNVLSPVPTEVVVGRFAACRRIGEYLPFVRSILLFRGQLEKLARNERMRLRGYHLYCST
jgi:hypothetical protein